MTIYVNAASKKQITSEIYIYGEANATHKTEKLVVFSIENSNN
jgi:hypothetical protein